MDNIDNQENRIYPWLLPMVNKFTLLSSQKKLAHAWLFYGQTGVGKAALIKQLSKQILAPNEPHKQQWIEANTHPDFMLLEPNDHGRIAIDSVREAITFLANTPAAAENKIICIHSADKMNVAAQSALLKTLEEPIGHAYLFLTAENTSQLLPTILSRCSKQVIGLPEKAEFDAWLATQPLTHSPEDILLAKTLAQYSPGLTLSLLSEINQKSLPLLLYLVSIVASQWEEIAGLTRFVEQRLGLKLPRYVFSAQSKADKQNKIEFYRYVCQLAEKVQLFPGMNPKLVLHSIEHFDSSNKRIIW